MTSHSSGNPLLARLRAETHERHARLDAIVGDTGLSSRDGYANFLQASLLAVSAIEGGVALKLGSHFVAQRAELLREDLQALGRPSSHPGLPELPGHEPSSDAAAWGCAYVVEGSALGGLALAQRVQLTIGANAPIGYLRLRGAATPTHWRDFLSRLARFAEAAPEDAHAQAAAGAGLTFDVYLRAFQRVFARSAS